MDTNDKKHTSGENAEPRRAPQRKRNTVRPKKRRNIDVVYTEPKAFNRNRFLLHLVTVVAVVVALLLGLSIFFKVENVVVSGAEKYSAWQVRQATDIQDGENLLTINAAKVSARIRTNLPYVNRVRVGIKLPDTVCIEIQELDVVYAIESSDDKWWLVDSTGRVVEAITEAESKSYTQIIGVQIDTPVVGNGAVAAEPEQESTATEGESSAPVTIRASDHLDAALVVVRALESNGILGQITSVDVTNIGSIEMWYGERYQVLAGDVQRMNYKMEAMKLAVEQSSQYQSGVLDVSFTIWPDQVGYTPF